MIPMEYNVVVEIDAVVKKSPGGIIMPDAIVDKEKLAAEEGTLIAVSDMAFDIWPDGSRKPQVGERVLVARHSGIMRERDGKTLRILKDKDIVAIIEGGDNG